MRAVLVLALLALVGAQVVSAGSLIYQQAYSTDYVNHPENFFCNGTAYPVAKNYTGGMCNNLGLTNSSSVAFYCDNGQNVIAISYSSGDCPAANATAMSKTPTTCGAGSTSAKWVCSGTDPLPSAFPFPPSGWSSSSTQYNNTLDGTANGESKGACGSVNRPVTVQSAGNPVCVNTQGLSTQSPRRSAQSFHDNWSATYNDYDCKAANVQTVTQSFPQGCLNGVTGSGISGGPDAPSVPISFATNNIKASRTQYSKTGDNNYCGTKLATQYIANTCFDSMKTVCENGTAYTDYNYGSNTDGACSGGQIAGYPIIRNTTSGNCAQIGTSDYGLSYSCSGDSPHTGSASTASFSVVALVIAAIVALISQ